MDSNIFLSASNVIFSYISLSWFLFYIHYKFLKNVGLFFRHFEYWTIFLHVIWVFLATPSTYQSSSTAFLEVSICLHLKHLKGMGTYCSNFFWKLCICCKSKCIHFCFYTIPNGYPFVGCEPFLSWGYLYFLWCS